ncbi:TPA: LysR family transcriptional regulator [Acinetobacter nosocomialis]|uniref:LysR family transcriptional regulator n=1 Tax=Acinetobacter nosocomialis TaxID=106654 RepID=A0AB37CWK6_ACINO|nr:MULTISPECIES: LysR family transcriptional regulator [Acinetobacter calcoaceticus/baumannii complex]ELW77987.1 LysR substrate-binding domain protein [Acinetobacter sp. OIFC021]EXE47188.1 bacterial regulatory helix-turn-helix, lysR family protein [Acinetobacter sp. 766875]MDE1667249.1 LysR family transcriptional regulator [Acinetobacter nosocomialis]MDE9417797.1 LysR family transcriptional regulator [Acinetobacter nosocomialis]QGA44342.1 LysR family transcriptional regulator [Acinetobacter no
MNINQEQLLMFQAVMETGSFSAAARKLGKVPSAVSMSIANLEIDLNLTLFERKGREPTPTAEARVLYEKTAQLLIEMNQWKQHAHALSTGLEPNLTIVVVSELLHTNWTDYVCLLESRFPDLQINIVSAPQEDALQMLLDGSAQLALMFEREHLDNREQFVELKREALIPVISKTHPLANQEHVSYEQILGTRQIVVASRDETLKPELLFSKHYWRTDNHHSACLMILRNLGWGVLPQEMFKENPELNNKLKALDVFDFTPRFEYYVDLVWSRESELGAAARFLIDYIRNKRMQQLP